MKIHKNLKALIKKYFGNLKSVPSHLRGFLDDINIDYHRMAQPDNYTPRNQDHYHLLADNITDVIWSMDLSLKLQYVSPSCLALTGYTPDELMQMRIDEFIVPASVEQILLSLARELETEKRVDADPNRAVLIDLEFLRKDRTTVWSEIRVTFLREHGKPVGLVGVARDNTERRLAEEKLRRSEEQYRTILETIEDGYYEVDLTGRYVFFNSAFCRMTGHSPDEILGKSFKEIMPEDSHRGIFKLFNEVYLEGVSERIMKNRYIRKDGNIRYAEGSVSLRIDSGGKKVGFCGIIRDTTEQMKMEHALRASEENLRIRNDIIEKDLQTAQLIQRSLLSVNLPKLDWVRAGYRYLPLDAVGGDYFSMVPLREGGMSVFIGDVASHGVTAALYLSLVKATSERICRDYALQPSKFITRLNIELCGNMPLSFLTATYGLFGLPRNGETPFTFSSGGHPLPILCRNGGEGVEYLRCKGTLVGIFENLEFQESVISLKKGDRIFLYTDGIPETTNERNELIGYDHLPELFRHCSGATLESTLDNIMEEINKFKGRARLCDDIVLLGFEITGD
jgi:sigma-B regulation protein RsbU (phosphoserine phosphatase)